MEVKRSNKKKEFWRGAANTVWRRAALDLSGAARRAFSDGARRVPRPEAKVDSCMPPYTSATIFDSSDLHL
jgi:hypothetical protein